VLPPGGAEIEIGVMFADIRGSTALAERMGPRDFAGLLDKFYAIASKALIDHKGVVDKMIGDEVMALFIPSHVGGDLGEASMNAARAILKGAAKENIPVGVGLHRGQAYVGKVGTENTGDFTAVGDTVNTTARLQAQAKAGEVVMSEAIYGSIAAYYPGLEARTIEVKGREQPVEIRVLRSPGSL
jgi:adenylate cyclase